MMRSPHDGEIIRAAGLEPGRGLTTGRATGSRCIFVVMYYVPDSQKNASYLQGSFRAGEGHPEEAGRPGRRRHSWQRWRRRGTGSWTLVSVALETQVPDARRREMIHLEAKQAAAGGAQAGTFPYAIIPVTTTVNPGAHTEVKRGDPETVTRLEAAGDMEAALVAQALLEHGGYKVLFRERFGASIQAAALAIAWQSS